jgi:hypothetical protein
LTGSPVFDQIEKLKQDLTDRYVVVDARIPELRRFEGHVGQVKTVNMNGRALVEFDAWNNIGWYDIEVSSLKVVPKPEPAAADAKHETKREAPPKPAAAKPPEGEKKLSPLEMARMQGAAKTAAKAGDEKAPPASAKPATAKSPTVGAKPSTADILAAARGAKSAAPTSPEKPAAAKPKMNTADILAAARAKATPSAGDAPPNSRAAEIPAAETPERSPVPPAATIESPRPAAAKQPAASSAPSKTALASGERPSVSEILAWCRQHDSK